MAIFPKVDILATNKPFILRNHLFIIVLFVFHCTVRGQAYCDYVFPTKDGKIYYEKIITVDSANKEALFTLSKLWATGKIVSQKSASKVEDPVLCILLYQSVLEVPLKVPSVNEYTTYYYLFDLKIQVKDQKAKISLEHVLWADATKVL